MRTSIVGLSAAAIAILIARPAAANGRFPASNQIVFSPTNENIIVGRATYAILPSNDNGKTWGYLCEDALGLQSVGFQDPEIGLTANNSIVVGLYAPTEGLDVSEDLGCNWSCIGGPLANQQIADIVVRPDWTPDGSALGSTSHQVLALTGTFGKSADAGTFSQVFQSTDDGTTWSTLGPPIDPTAIVATIDVATTDPMRIYVSANRYYGTARTASLFVSIDNGASWVEHPVAAFNPPIPCVEAPGTMCPSEDQLFIAAVDPTDENRVYLRSTGLSASTPTPGDSRLYVTTDGGQTFQVIKDFPLGQENSDYTEAGELLGFALSPDGSKVYIGTKETGLWSASKTDLTFSNVNSKIGVQCLAARQASTGPELWACASEPFGGFVFGKSTDNGVTFTPMMATITSMSGPVSCSGAGTTSDACFTDANASACSCSGYAQFCTAYETSACYGCGMDGPPGASDAGGGSDGGVDEAGTGGSKTPPRNASCGCAVVGGGSAAGFFAGWAIVAIAVRRRRAR